MSSKNTTEQKYEGINRAWRELQDAIQSAPLEDLRSIIANDSALSLVNTRRSLDCSIGQLVTLIKDGELAALQVLHNGCCLMSMAVDSAAAHELIRPTSESGQALDLQAVRADFDDAIDDLIDLVRLGEPGALELLLGNGIGIASMLANSKTHIEGNASDHTHSSLTPPTSVSSSVDPTWRNRLNNAIQNLVMEPPGMLMEAFRTVNSDLRVQTFAIKKLSPSLPEYDPDNPDIEALYEVCDRLIEKRLNPKGGRYASIREFLDGAWLHKLCPTTEPVSPELFISSKSKGFPKGSPTEFASQVYQSIRHMHVRSYPVAHLEDIRKDRKKQLGGTILKELQASKTKSLKRGWVGSGEEWINFRSPLMILDHLVALLPPLSKETVMDWVDASVAYVFVWCDGNFENCTWPESVQKAIRSTGGTPSAIRKTLVKGYKSLVNANTEQADST